MVRSMLTGEDAASQSQNLNVRTGGRGGLRTRVPGGETLRSIRSGRRAALPERARRARRQCHRMDWDLDIESDGTRRFTKPSPSRPDRPIVKRIGPALPLEGESPFVEFAAGLAAAHGVEVVEWTAPGLPAGAPLGFGLRAVRVPRLTCGHAAYVFAHEVAHHVLGHRPSAPVWRNEIEADTWAVTALHDAGLLTPDVELQAHRHLVNRLHGSLRSSKQPAALARRIADRLPDWVGDDVREYFADLADPDAALDRVRSNFFGPGLGRRERTEAFERWWVEDDHNLDGQRLGQLVRELWMDTEYPWALAHIWEEVWSLEHIDTMTGDERRALVELSDPVEIFRGFAARADSPDVPEWWGLSWTIDRSKAEWFARRFSHGDDGRLATTLVSKAAVRALLLERDEAEVVVLPWELDVDVTVSRVEPETA